MADPRELLSPRLAGIQAYHVQDVGLAFKLDAMENPYSFPEPMRRAWVEKLATVDLNRYPDPVANDLRGRIVELDGIPADWPLMLGNGSDELIQLLCLAIVGRDRPVMAPQPSFVMYSQLAAACNLDFVGVDLKADFSLDLPAMLDAIDRHKPGLIFLAQPNNPTANLFDDQAVREICAAASGLVILDEAYLPYADHNALSLAREFEQVLILRTLSKWGLAGLRLGYLAGPAAWMDELEKLRLPYNINVLTQASALFALQHASEFDRQVSAIRAERERVALELGAVQGFEVFPSATNFLLLRTPPDCARPLFESLKSGGVLIKCLDGAHPLLRDCLRLTIGMPAENDRLLEIIESCAPFA